MKRQLRNGLLPAIGIGAVLLAACGGSDGDGAPAFVANTDVPLTATTSTAGAVSFAQQTMLTNDLAEPAVLGDAALATSETDEPDPSV